MLVDHHLEIFEIFVRHWIELDHLLVDEWFELVVFVIDVSDAAAHAGRKVPARPRRG